MQWISWDSPKYAGKTEENVGERKYITILRKKWCALACSWNYAPEESIEEFTFMEPGFSQTHNSKVHHHIQSISCGTGLCTNWSIRWQWKRWVFQLTTAGPRWHPIIWHKNTNWDFNAQISSDRIDYDEVIGPHGMASSHSNNAERLMSLCSTV